MTSPRNSIACRHRARLEWIVFAGLGLGLALLLSHWARPHFTAASLAWTHTNAKIISSNETAQTRPPLAKISATEPLRPLAAALAETDPARRDESLEASLREWASVDPDAAADWAQSQNVLERGRALATVFRGASRQPAAAVQLAQRLTAQDPAEARSYGNALIFALSQRGDFKLGADFAAEAAEDSRTDLLTLAYQQWAQHSPHDALTAARELADSAAQTAAWQSAVSGWAMTNPQQLALVAIKLPRGEERAFALTAGVRSWIERDPASAAAWIREQRFTPEMEAALEL
jgi:hypothetical protein